MTNPLIFGTTASGQIGTPLAVPISVIAGQPHLIFAIPQVVNLTYQANIAYRSGGYTGYGGTILHNAPVDRTNFRLIQGVLNEVYFVVRDSARQPVQTGSFTLILTAETRLLQTTLTLDNIHKGRYLATISADDSAQLPLGPIRWTIAYQRSDQTTVLLWTDHNSPYGTAVVMVPPTPAERSIIIPWAEFSPLTAPPCIGFITAGPQYFTSPLVGAGCRPYSDGTQAFVASMTDFTGTLRIDATLCSQPDDSASWSDWVSLLSNDYTTVTGTDTLSVTGNFVWVRLVVTLSSGALEQVQYRI